ncbi:kelch-like protein 10 [Centropristis striata]|uniref:kelch-like protein 10 n=1 Tax=Centropristis striata TaxID=184440 RepID=UPI0027E077CE|nr:kelch-like protein 10 [Centropristis striata]
MSVIFSTTINELRLQGKLCDAVIRVDHAEFKVHRIILCNFSTYFRNLFRHTASTGQQVYSFIQVSPSTMGLILNYVYTGSVMVTEENVLELLAGADYFGIKGVMLACCDFLVQHLSYKNCIHIWMLANFHKCPELSQKAYLHMLHHFEEVAGFSRKFLQVSVKQLADLLEKDELNVRQESVVFEAILRWVDYDPEGRKHHMPMLLSKVRLVLMSIKYLNETVNTNVLVSRSLPCIAMVMNALKTLQSNMERPLTRTRLPSAVLLAIGGWGKYSTTNRIDFYNVRADSWARMKSEWAPHAFQGSVVLNGFVYCIGGYDGKDYLRRVQKLNLVTQTWQEVAPMQKVRGYVSVVALNGCIYAIGGSDRHGKLKTAERYQPDTNQWTLIAPMHKNRSNAGIATLHGKVYVCGGFNRAEPMTTCECYNPQTNQWELIGPMESGCNAARAIAYKNRIYVVGGYRDGSNTSRVIAYDPLSKQWSTVQPMINYHCSFGIAVLEEQLYVVGGFDNNGCSSKVERYDENTNRWQAVQDMEMPRGGLSCCVVERHHFTTAYDLSEK